MSRVTEVDWTNTPEGDRLAEALRWKHERAILLEALRSVVSYEWGKSPTMDSVTRHSILSLIRQIETP